MSSIDIRNISSAATAVVMFGAICAGRPAIGEPLGYAQAAQPLSLSIFQQMFPDRRNLNAVEHTNATDETDSLPATLTRHVIAYQTHEAPGTVVIDTPNTRLYYVLGGGKAISYGIGVGRDGFTWSGVQTVSRKSEWPDWIPPAEMIQRQPYLPRFVAGGVSNPLGARAIYLGNTIYRIHGTNAPETIGTHVSSGCIRMVNNDVIDLYSRINVGTKVVVLPDQRHQASTPATIRRPPAANSRMTTASTLRASRVY
jgi:lipoprotein-anchoring transpeptidase ErfK/SrfK